MHKFGINLFTLNRDVPVYWKNTVALLHYDKVERALYILHNRDEFDGDKPHDFAQFSTQYRYGWWLTDEDHDESDDDLKWLTERLKLRDDNIGRL